jgi:hypothetical protein
LISPRLAVGAGLEYYHETAINSFILVNPNPGGVFINNKSILNRWSITPFLRFYFPVADDAGLFLESGFHAGIGQLKRFPDQAPVDADLLSAGVNLRPAFYYFINHRICLEAGFGSLSYLFSQTKNALDEFGVKENSTATSFGINLNDSLGFSFRYFLGNAATD